MVRDSQTEGESNAEKADAQFREGCGEDCAAATPENKPECSENSADNLFSMEIPGLV
jgi:hypothetical protein